jgi:AcrR family transcriptional regulator
MSNSSQKTRGDTAKVAKAPIRRRGRERVSALLDAAAEVFAAEGFDAATMTAIAAKAGASIGSLYQYFPTKELIAAELHTRNLDTLARMLETLIEESRGVSLDVTIDRLFADLIDFLEANPAFLTLGERRSLDPAVKKKARARLRGLLDALLSEAAPPVPAARRTALAAVILHLVRVAASVSADDDRSVRSSAPMELRDMLKTHLAAKD